MIALIQRVSSGKVTVKNKLISEIAKGYVILLGIFEEDEDADVLKLVEKISSLRIMSDAQDKMNLSIVDVKGEILLVSQFTLVADLTSGRRPSFIKAKSPDMAKPLYELFIHKLKEKGIPVKTGQFGTYMQVNIVNDGPVTIIADSKNSKN